MTLDEAGVDQGSQEGAVVTSGSGSITTSVGSDIIDHYELEPTEFNVGAKVKPKRLPRSISFRRTLSRFE